jgi:hypothetical protein
MNTWAILAVGVALGFSGGYVVATQRAPSLAVLEQTRHDHAEVVEELRKLTRRLEARERTIEHLARAADQRLEAGHEGVAPQLAVAAGAQPAPELDEPEQVEPTPEQKAAADSALREATRLVDQGIAKGAWNEQDAQNLRMLMPALPAELRSRAVDKIIAAINAQQMRIETVGAPF